jgi:hypothetical protein
MTGGTVHGEVSSPVYGYGSYYRRGRAGTFSSSELKRVFGFLRTQEWLAVVLTVVTLGVAVYSVEQAKWITSQPPLTFLLVVSVLATAVVMRLKLPAKVRLLSVTVLGLLAAIWQASRMAGQQGLWQALLSKPNEGTVHFAVFIILVTWAAGACSIWLVLKKRNAWLPAGLGAVVLLVNLSNLPPEYFGFLPVYLLVALILVGMVSLIGQQAWFHEKGNFYPRRGTIYTLISVVLIGLVAVASAWFVPGNGVESVGFDANGRFLAVIQKNVFNIFASVPGKWSVMKNEDLQKLSFDAPLDNRETVLFLVTASKPAYWRIKRYQNYNSWGWTSSPVETGGTIKPGMSSTIAIDPGRQDFSYSVETRSKTDVLLLAGEFKSSNLTVRLETQGASTESPIVSDVDITAVITPELIQPKEQYSVVGSISSAGPEQLINATTDYTDWVKSNYLQLPTSLPDRVRQLALIITEGTTVPFQQAMAIQDYLQGLRYNRDAKSPSRRGDEVDSFLFMQREGVCTDFATSMIVMLRSLGVPARLATGYLPGEQDSASGAYIVRGKDYHAWPEVFFPGFGWIQFEPTPRPGIDTSITAGGGNGGYQEQYYPELYYGGGEGLDGQSTTDKPTQSRPNVALPVIGIILLVAVVGGVLWMIVSRLYQSLRMSGDAPGVYTKMCRLASLVDVGPFAAETPFEYCHRLSLAFPEGAQAISSIAELYSEACFSPRKDLAEAQVARLQKSWVDLYPVLFKQRLPWRR